MNHRNTPSGGNETGLALAIGAYLAQNVVPPNLTAAAPIRPFQFASLSHLDDGVKQIIQRAAAVEGLRPSTTTWMKNGYDSVRRFITQTKNEQQLIGGDFLQQREVLTLWTGWLLQNGISRVTARTYWRAMSAICRRFEMDHGMLNLFRYVQAPRTGRHLPKSLTRADAKAVLLFVRNFAWSGDFERARNTAVVSMMMLAGLRRMEVARLRREDIHEDDGIIDIRGAKGAYGGKDRTAYMPQQLLADVRVYLGERTRRKATSPAFYLAVGADAGIGAGTMKRVFRIVTESVGFRVSPHRLRHTYATLLRQAGIADRVSMDLLGHEQLSTLQRYSRVFEPEYREQVQKLTVDLS
jgi:integrase